MSIFYALKSDSLSFKMFCMYFAVSEIESSLEGTQNSIHCIGNLFAKLTSSCYCNGTRTHNHLVRKRTLNHLAKQKQKKKKKKITIKCTVQISTHNTAQSFGQFG